MKRSKEITSIVESTKLECYYFKLMDLKALFELYFKVKDIYVGSLPEGEWDWSGIIMLDIPNSHSFPSKKDDYSEWSDRLTDMYNEQAIPKGKYLIDVS